MGHVEWIVQGKPRLSEHTRDPARVKPALVSSSSLCGCWSTSHCASEPWAA